MKQLKNIHLGQTAWIIGKGPSLQYLKKEDIGEGPVITLNSAIIPIESLGLDNPIYSMQKDGGGRKNTPPGALRPDCDFSGIGCDNCPRMNRPKGATLLLHDIESRHCFPDYSPRVVLNLENLGLPENVFSLIFAIKAAQYMGCNRFNIVSCDVHANGDLHTYNHEDDYNPFYCEQIEKLTPYLNGLDYSFITPEPNGIKKPMKISNLKLCIGIPLTFPMVPSGFFYSFAHMEKPKEYTLIHADNGSGAVDALRNDLVDMALQIGASHLIMMDTDQIYPVETIPQLLSHRLPVVGCVVHRRYPPFDPILLRGKMGDYESIDEWADGELVEVDATGTGCMMFNMEVFRKMPKPWFKFRKLETGEGIGEDIGFCSDLREAGYRIFVDTAIQCGHLTTLNVTKDTYKLYKAMKVEQHKKALTRALASGENKQS